MLHFESAGKTYRDGTVAAKDISLSVPKGQFCVILGPSGAGKSTMLRMVNGLVAPSSGRLLLAGTELNKRSLKRLRTRVSMIHQQFNLVPRLSVYKNVLSGALAEISTLRALCHWFTPAQRRRVCHLLHGVGLGEQHLTRRASALSGGQQQRVGICRAFILNPWVVLADEPVASLDPRTSVTILQILRDSAAERGTTVLCSLHQVDLAKRFADRIIGMHAGRVVYDGPPAQMQDATLDLIYDGRPLCSGDGKPLDGTDLEDVDDQSTNAARGVVV